MLGFGETDQERSDRERARIAHETAMRNATVPGGGSGGPRAPLPPGTVKTPWQQAADAVGNAFNPGGGPALPPGTHAEGEAGGSGETTNASPPISSAGAPNWGLYVGLSVAAVAAVALIAVLTKKPSVANRRRNRRRRNGKHRGAIKGFRVNDLVQYTHADDRRTHAGYQGRIIELSPLSALVDWGHRKGSYWVPYNRLMQV